MGNIRTLPRGANPFLKESHEKFMNIRGSQTFHIYFFPLGKSLGARGKGVNPIPFPFHTSHHPFATYNTYIIIFVYLYRGCLSHLT